MRVGLLICLAAQGFRCSGSLPPRERVTTHPTRKVDLGRFPLGDGPLPIC